MNCISAVKLYIDKIVDESGPGMKILLMDKETTSVVSMAYSQSEMLQKEVYLFERIDAPRSTERMKYMKCLVFIRPHKTNVGLLSAELKAPKYGSYYIYFSNIIPRTDIKVLAESDESESVREIREVYADYLCVNSDLFSLNIPQCMHNMSWTPEALYRSVEGLISVLLSLKLRPVIRFRQGSEMAQQLGKLVYEKMTKESTLFEFRVQEGAPPPLLLILDRRDDPVTPLLNQWTYQAMVHELLGIRNNRVDLSSVQAAPKDMKEVVMSGEQDEFYRSNMYSNFGEIGATIKSLMDEFQKKSTDQKKVESIADMKNFVESYPQFKKMSGTVTKHVVVIGELSAQVGKNRLMEISELEQEISCKADHSAQLQRIKRLVADPNVKPKEALRLVLLYALHYERHANCDIVGLLQALQARGGAVHLVPKMLEYAGKHFRQGELFSAVKITKNFIKGLKGVENVFTQHNCLFTEILEDAIRGRPIDPNYPTIGNDLPPFRRPPQLIVAFVIGGVTYEEALAVHNLNQSGANIVLGGTTVHSSETFLKEVAAATAGIHFKHTRSLQAFQNVNTENDV